jgi:hypothetical protein
MAHDDGVEGSPFGFMRRFVEEMDRDDVQVEVTIPLPAARASRRIEIQ